MDDPPYEINGSGTPVIGINPRVIPIFSNIWNENHAMTPVQTNRPKGSGVLRAIEKARINKIRYKIKINPLPTNPSSSPATVKIKSVCCSGTNRPLVCGPSNNPVPSNPPEPTVIRACRNW